MKLFARFKNFMDSLAEKREKKKEDEMKKREQEVGDMELAHQVNLSKNEYLRLAEGPFSVAMILARNHCIPGEAIHLLLRHPNPRVRAAVLENQNISREDVNNLIKDSDEAVKDKARETLQIRFNQEGVNPSSFYLAIFLANDTK